MSGTNDNDPDHELPARGAKEPDAYGQAAFLLLESLIHHLVASEVVTNQAAIEVVEVALDVKAEIAHDLGDSPATLKQSLDLLERLAATLQTDARGEH